MVVSDNIFQDEDRGYGLVITRERIIGSRKPDSMGRFQAFLDKGASEADRSTATRVAQDLLASRRFEVRVGSVGQALYSKPTLLSGGYLVIKTGLRSIRVDIDVLYVEPGLEETARVMVEALNAALGWRLCDARTGFPLKKTTGSKW